MTTRTDSARQVNESEWDPATGSLDLATLGRFYREGTLKIRDVVNAVYDRIERRGDDHVWIHLVPRALALKRAASLDAHRGGADPSLYGVPFAVKDNIDVAGCATTAACPAFAYVPEATAPAVERLLAAGAILIGKTNLDQFATGLVGVRSPYGICRNSINPAYIAGGSSAGSAVAVAAGLVSFALGTDTAGSGRVPAAFNNIVGLKPSRGLVSTDGVVPTCKTLDCVSIFTLTCADALSVLDYLRDEAALNPAPVAPVTIGALRFGVPDPAQMDFFGDSAAQSRFDHAVARLEALGARRVTIDFAPFREAAALLYDGPWVAERKAGIRNFIESQPQTVNPVVRAILAQGDAYSAVDAFEAMYRLEGLRRQVDKCWDDIDVLVLPTTGTIYTIDAVLEEPRQLNSNLGYYTNFVNLLDLCALAVPAGFLPNGLPIGLSLIAPRHNEGFLCRLGEQWHRAAAETMGATGNPFPEPVADVSVSAFPHGRISEQMIKVAVFGLHLSGQPLNPELVRLGAKKIRDCRTAPRYRLYRLNSSLPEKPGLVQVARNGHSIVAELWAIPLAAFGVFVSAVPTPLCIGTVALENGDVVKSFLCEAIAVSDAEDISHHGGWLGYLQAQNRERSTPDRS